MNEKLIIIENIELINFLGTNNNNLEKLKEHFSNLKLISRGNKLKVIGNNNDIKYFESKLNEMLLFIKKNDYLNINNIEQILNNNDMKLIKESCILFGYKGKKIKTRTINQSKMVLEMKKNDMIFVTGPAGTGKTYTAVALAVNSLKNKEVKKIILTRPAIEAGENIGFLPGDLKDKLDPYMQPLYDALSDMIPLDKLNKFIDDGIIQIAPLAFMRGRTLDNAFVILDEGQNTTESQMKMFLTRMGICAKFIITADETQIDLKNIKESGILSAKKVLKNIKGISFVTLNESDVVRHELVKKIIKKYKKIKR